MVLFKLAAYYFAATIFHHMRKRDVKCSTRGLKLGAVHVVANIYLVAAVFLAH